MLVMMHAGRAELGRLPIKCKAVARSLSYWLKLIDINSEIQKLSTLIYQAIKNEKSKAFWSNKIKNALDHVGLGTIWMSQNEPQLKLKQIKKVIKQRISDIEIQNWWSNIHNDIRKDSRQKNKLRIFRQFKRKYVFEDYLSHVTNTKHRVAFTKLRISNHRLEVEMGRYRSHRRSYLTYEQRICPVCNMGIESEKHFLTWCPLYDTNRKELAELIKNKTNININNMNTDNRFLFLMNPRTSFLQKTVSAHVYKCMLIRERKLET